MICVIFYTHNRLFMNDLYIKNEPSPSVLMTSMRSMGYTFQSAISDVIDNSISASAKNIKLVFPIEPTDCYIAICDDGCGMTKEELFNAMKYGSSPKFGVRSESDLGRFGLGLKAASLSQCKKLTVISKKNGEISAYIWDLDTVLEKNEWYLLDCTSKQISKFREIHWLDNLSSGTIVLWEEFDLIEKSSGMVYEYLTSIQNNVSEYLSLIFHRFLNSSKDHKVNISINNYLLKGKDPFLEDHKKTDKRKLIQIPIMDSSGVERTIFVQAYILPFQQDLSEEDEILSGGVKNYKSKQGFYIYRNERLIIWGSWFGRDKDELTKYARIKVDIPNSLDDIWSIDIKKQNANIPNVIKKRLNQAVNEALDRSISKQRFRGRVKNSNEQIDFVWNRFENRGLYSYRINRNAKVFQSLKNEVSDEIWSKIDDIFESIEESVPFQQIYIDKTQNVIDESLSEEELSSLIARVKAHIEIFMEKLNFDKKTAVDAVFKLEPFCNYPKLREKI